VPDEYLSLLNKSHSSDATAWFEKKINPANIMREKEMKAVHMAVCFVLQRIGLLIFIFTSFFSQPCLKTLGPGLFAAFTYRGSVLLIVYSPKHVNTQSLRGARATWQSQSKIPSLCSE
jgi:hypothetical protein